VVSSNTVNTFKHRVDRPKYWFDQDEKYNKVTRQMSMALKTAVL